jgi:hypothetical protein
MDHNYWLQEIESVERECVPVRHRLASLPVRFVSEYIVHYAVIEFTKIIASYNDNGRPLITSLYERKIHDDICSNMMKAVLLPCMSTCDIGITESEFVQELLIKLLYAMPNLKALTLPSKERLNYTEFFVERIPILTQLQEFRFHVGCTTEIIIELSKYCPHLKKLSVQDSRRVDDECVEHLLKLTHLRALNVSKTSISITGYRGLLSGLPQVQDIVWFGPIDPVLWNLTKCLPSVRKFIGTILVAELLVQKCPNITELVQFSFTKDISDLAELRNLAGLSIIQCSCTDIRFGEDIRRLGPSLTKLEMFQILTINVDDVINSCTALNVFNITLCYIRCSGTFDRKLPHFVNLKELRLIHNRGPFLFSSILHLYVNLKALHVVGMGDITDEVIRQIVTAGGFRNVTEFVVEHCGDMGIETAFFIIQNCPNLTKLGNLNSWPRVTNGELVTLVNFVRENNLSITVY